LSDATELREMLINLVFNAVDALPQGGAITFVTRTFRRVAAEAGKQESELQVEVRDNGIGMDEKIRQRCLEPFFSTKAQRGGTGLGLAMVYGVMHRHDGTIDIESSAGRGTCARLTFPIRDKLTDQDRVIRQPAAPQDVASEVKQNRALRVLCIDDEPQIRQLLNDCLTNFNHRVTVASTGKRGTELFREAMKRNQPYEAVITDLGMPEVDGHQVARTIKTESPNTPVIMMTGWGTMMKEDGETVQQVDAVISKPPLIKELNELLLRVTASNNSAA
jgi:CheY-like chemotaxis protein